MKKLLPFLIILFALNSNAQSPTDSTKTYATVRAEKFIPVYHRPILKDESLLFFNDSITCECEYINDMYNVHSPIDKTDFKRVSKCFFKEKLFVESKNSIFDKPHYKFKSEKIVGELIRIENNIFEYKEYSSDKKVKRVEKFEFKFDQVSENVQNIYFDNCFNEFEEKFIYFEVNKIE